MAPRKGVVVATHPEDHSVDLVMVDNGQRLVGVQVQTPSGSARSGTVDLPEVPEKADKWDITKEDGQDMLAIVDYVGRTPIVTGFLYPQINQMLFKDPRMRFSRHRSDVMTYTDGDGNFGIMHPSGAFIQVGEKPERPELAGQNADGSLAIDRNTERKVFLRVALAGNVAELTMTPDGYCTLKLAQDLAIECQSASVKAPGGMEFDTPVAHFTGKITSDGDQVAGGVSQMNHEHDGVVRGNSKTNKPIQ